ncbi:LysR family transcriptional regulator, partial [Oxalobacteraceae bacterium OM1]
TASFGYGLLPDMVRQLRGQVPGISLTLRELVTTAQLEALAAGRLDIGLMRPHPEHGELETVLLAQDALVLAIPEAEADRWPASPRLADLQDRPFLMYSPYEARYFYQLLQGCFDHAGVRPEVVEYVSQIHTMLALVGSGVGAALIPGAATRLHFSGIVLRKLNMTPAMPVETVCSFRKDNDNPMIGIFLERILPPFRERLNAAILQSKI